MGLAAIGPHGDVADRKGNPPGRGSLIPPRLACRKEACPGLGNGPFLIDESDPLKLLPQMGFQSIEIETRETHLKTVSENR